MSRTVVGLIFAALVGFLAQDAAAGPRGGVQGGSRYVAAGGGGAYVTGGHGRPVYPGVRHGGYGGYWGPSVGVYYGGPGYWGWPYGWGAGYGYGYGYGYPYSYGYAPVVVNTTPVPQTFIEQEAAPPVQTAPSANYWYYCNQPAGYFPHIQGCSHPWIKVIPQAPGDTSTPRVAP
jgi:hypothetical protein